MKDDSRCGVWIEAQERTDVPGNAFSLAVIVTGQDDFAPFRCRVEFGNGVFFGSQGRVRWFPVAVYKVKAFFQGANMPHGRMDFVVRAQETGDLGAFGG